MPEFLAIGLLGRMHGVEGEIRMKVLTDFPERIQARTQVFIGEDHQPARVRRVRWQNEDLLVVFDNYENRQAAAELRNQMVYVRTQDLPALAEGEYYHHQLIGLRVFDETHLLLGQVSEILSTGSNDVLVVDAENRKEILVPILEDTILEVDTGLGEMSVRLLPGLLEI